jgi:hypothetical protein
VGKYTRNFIKYCLNLGFVHIVFCLACIVVLSCVYCCSCLVCIVALLCCCLMGVLLLSYVYFLYYVHIAVVLLDAGLLARSQYSEGPATGHHDTGFSWFPYVYKRMLRWFPRFQVATTCFSCSPPDLKVNLLVISFIYVGRSSQTGTFNFTVIKRDASVAVRHAVVSGKCVLLLIGDAHVTGQSRDR